MKDLMKTEMKTFSFKNDPENRIFCFHERLVEDDYGQEIEVVFWVEGDKEATLQTSQDPDTAELQILRSLEHTEEVEYPDNCGLEL